MQLYKIADQYKLAFDKMSADEELTPEIIEDSLSDLKDEFETKAIHVSYHIKNKEAEAKAIKEAEHEMQKRRKKLEKEADGLRDYLKINMERCKITEPITTPHFIIKIKKCAQHVEILDIKKVPKKFMLVIPATEEPDKVSLREYLKDHEVDYAKLSRNSKLEIK